MSDLFKVANLSVEQGKKIQGFLKVYNSEVEMPITLINGAKPGKTVVITGGTHGGEYPGVETAIRLASQLNPDEVSGRIAIVHPVNVRAFLAKTQYVGPDDGKNLNRLFPGKATGTFSERIAYTITSELFSQADFYMDLHGGDIHEALVPFVLYSVAAKADVQKISEEAAAAMGIKYVVGSMSVTGSFGSAAVSGIPGFLAEIGQCGLWSEEEVLVYLKGVKNVLRYLRVLSGEPKNLGSTVILPKMIGSAAEQTGCWYPAVKPGDLVVKGQKLGEIRDYFTNTLGEYFASQDATVLYVISSLAINIGDPIVAIG
ncbi:MAG: succinylglutamate desuccinylase/aspartoacylase family protein [Negativicutes bacterium]|nr:succinylglutamate desuccinylase/aspartoacylase family protein [Negativicutes bacterium]